MCDPKSAKSFKCETDTQKIQNFIENFSIEISMITSEPDLHSTEPDAMTRNNGTEQKLL